MQKSPTKRGLFQLFAPILGILGIIFLVGYKLLFGWCFRCEHLRTTDLLRMGGQQGLDFVLNQIQNLK